MAMAIAIDQNWSLVEVEGRQNCGGIGEEFNTSWFLACPGLEVDGDGGSTSSSSVSMVDRGVRLGGEEMSGAGSILPRGRESEAGREG